MFILSYIGKFVGLLRISAAFIVIMLSITSVNAQVNNNLLPDSGNVGIGTTTPSEKLEVNGNAVFTGSLTVDSMQVQNNINVDGAMEVSKDLLVSDSLRVGNKVVVDKSLYVADTLYVGGGLKVSSISNVGSIKTEEITATNYLGTNGEITFGDPEDGGGTPCDALRFNYCTRVIYGFTQGTPSLYPGVAIGATSMASGQHSFSAGMSNISSGTASISLGRRVRATGDGSIAIGFGSESSGFFVNNIAQSMMVGFGADVPSLFVGSTTSGLHFGNVGIGTAAPSDALQIGEGAESITFGAVNNSDAGWMLSYMGFNAKRIRTATYQSSTWNFSTFGGMSGGAVIASGNGRIYLIPVPGDNQSSGQSFSDADLYDLRVVSIEARQPNQQGTALAGGIMRVNGKIFCQEVEVTIDPAFWWDEVFAPEYELRSFEELQAYIEANKHLPDVPSEQEVSENGLSMGESYGILLRKIEELTLYMLELKKENEELRKLIEAQ